MRVAAQDALLAQGAAPDLYLVHTVKKGETWYSLGRAYGLSPKDIAARNNMQMENGLSLGKQITIPLNKGNFVQSKDAAASSGVRPVYHHVGDKETLYRISLRYGKVPLDNVREWNKFTGDGVQKDAMLIVGYVKGTSNSIVQTPPAPTSTPPAEPVTTASTPPPAPVTTPAAATPTPAATTPAVAATPAPAPENTAPVATTPAPVQEPVATTPAVVKQETPATVVESEKQSSSLGRTPVIPDGGFEQTYLQQTNNGRDITTEKGPGTWFRSNAIVGSGKYYALHNSAPRGTIVKVTNPLTGKSIYAKVLDAIPQLKANANLIIKLSDAAQEALGINEARFYCELRYDEK
ncbi:LysM peptidoglycan-binding domain-containing protein [Chitinophaga cymbidii]|uniref:LysM domain-containing protein n=1 Tax=Chitinophaga cymbidii TaxID=1096750 RepID=A0A512RLH0_9BACT|nr:LysM peptidoglycan-binding domain-containing protein [Chitinophaga cymbidii]GEP96554.1 hypothetical protein CCY01nite_28140 [Chitinophaga cymbidii]